MSGTNVHAGCDSNDAELEVAQITTAVNFLQNSKVRHTTLMQKQQFLKTKGLTMEEIQLACDRAGVFSQDPNTSTVMNMDISTTTDSHTQLALQPQAAFSFGRIRKVIHSMALISGIAYAIYIFWKKFNESFFLSKKEDKSSEDTLVRMDAKVDSFFNGFSQELAQIKETLTQQQREQTQNVNREFENFKTELEAIKGLLLNRQQFASPLNSVLVPSIPAWQLTASPHHLDCHRQTDDGEKADDAGSGSGSSETEVVTKNSNSSLEIM